MDNSLQDKLKVLKIGYLEKLKEIIPEFWQMYEKISTLPIDELYIKVHTISGTSGMYGLSKLSAASTEFELYIKEIKKDITLKNDIELKERLYKYIKNIETAE